MKYKFAYKTGHNQELSLNEFLILSKDNDYAINDSYIFSNTEINISDTGSLIFKALIHEGYPKMPKKIGFVTTASKKSILDKLKALGAKKILLSEKLPNIGQFKYVKNWFVDYGDFLLELVEFFNQELWSKLDMGLPSKDMKRGIINLKLARSMNNFSSLKNIHDPFAGLGRNAFASYDKDLNFVLSDIDQLCEKEINLNADYVENNLDVKAQIKKIYTIDALKIENEFDGEEFAIVTEGYLTESANAQLYINQAERRVYEIKDFWLPILQRWAMIESLKEVILTLPVFLIGNEEIIWDIKKDLKKTFLHQPFKNQDYIVYKRKNSRIGHMIVKLIR
jgi:hypothetical protein